jgi:HD-GYP domain-containing protein (c-di-GMP phosphodiesterase class II)
MLLNDKKTELTIHTVYGADYDTKKRIHLKLPDNSPLERIIQDKRPMIISGIFLQSTHEAQFNQLFSENLLCAPLLYQDHVSGIITLSRSQASDENFSEQDLGLVFNLACQTAVAIENSKLNRDIEKTYFETISALALAVDAKDEYSRGHLDRVSDYALMIGTRLGLDDDDLNTLRDAARLHDLGKIGIPDEILKKAGPLSDEEWVIMRRHPEIGESIIKPIRSLQHLCDPIRHHHERIDGSGYPDGLKGDEISPLVRILAVADAYDALTTERSYRPKESKQQAIAILRSMKELLDQDIVNLLLEGLDV